MASSPMTSRRRTWPMNEPTARSKPATRSRPGAWLDHHAYSVVASLGRLLRRPWSTVLTIGVMAVAMALPLGLWLVLGNVERFAGDVQASRQLTVFLHQDTDETRVAELAAELGARADIGAIEHRTPAQGLEELRERSGLDEAIDTLG